MTQRAATEVLGESFLEVRAKLLEVAATLDRIDRAADQSASLADSAAQQRATLTEAIEILLNDQPERAERLQHLFSRDYRPQWREEMKL